MIIGFQLTVKNVGFFWDTVYMSRWCQTQVIAANRHIKQSKTKKQSTA